ncbi:MAG: hypothetical protein AVDCRST_MAG01-01-4368, partial [uncultured Rubrobacteraceae bacterium]
CPRGSPGGRGCCKTAALGG